MPGINFNFLFFQTAEEYRLEYDNLRGGDYSRFHGYTYDGIWTMALAIQHVALRIRHYRKNDTMKNFRYRDELWEQLFLQALKNTSFEGVTVSFDIFSLFWSSFTHFTFLYFQFELN